MKEALQSWVCSMLCCLCLMQLVEQILPSEHYRKYIRLFSGILFLIILLAPLTDQMNLTQMFEEQWENAIRVEAWDSLSMEQERLDELRNKTIEDAYEKEVKRQITEMASDEGLEDVKTELKFQKDSAWEISEVHICGNYTDDEKKEEIQEQIRRQILEIYQIKKVFFVGE